MLLLFKRLCYFWLHPVTSSDEVSVTSTLLGQPIDKSRAGPFSNPKGETPEIKQFIFNTLHQNATHIINLFVASPVGTCILLNQIYNFFSVAHLSISKDKQLRVEKLCNDYSELHAHICEG